MSSLEITVKLFGGLISGVFLSWISYMFMVEGFGLEVSNSRWVIGYYCGFIFMVVHGVLKD